MYRLALTRNIESAHRSDQLGSTLPGRSALHGHSYVCTLWLEAAAVDDRGVIRDLDTVSTAFATICDSLDHTLLNDVEGLDHPTMECVCRYVFDRARQQLPETAEVTLERPTLGFKASYRAG